MSVNLKTAFLLMDSIKAYCWIVATLLIVVVLLVHNYCQIIFSFSENNYRKTSIWAPPLIERHYKGGVEK